MPTIKELVKDNKVIFDSYRAGFFYYNIYHSYGFTEEQIGTVDSYQFTVPIDDIGNATLLPEDKAITFMRWIRKAIESNTLIKINK